MGKVAYLTVDDSPSEETREKVDYLAERGIRAVLFCRGELLEKWPDNAIYAISKGFIIGNHSYNHPHFSNKTLVECYGQIARTDALIEGIYATAGIARPAKYFRFPFGDKGGLTGDDVLKPYSDEGQSRKDGLQAFLRELGYTQPAFADITYEYYRKAGLLDDADWHWTYDCLEYCIKRKKLGIDSVEKVLARMDEDVPEDYRGLNHQGSSDIVLLHDKITPLELFKTVVDKLLTKNLEFRAPL